jgi:transposase
MEPSTPTCPRCRELEARVGELEARIARLVALCEAQQREIEELKARLGRNSGNSSMPPSSDLPGRKKGRRKRGSGRRPGGQPGHPGSYRDLLPSDQADEIVEHFPEKCGNCGYGLPPTPSDEPLRRQIWEIPALKPHVTEHRLNDGTCPRCGAHNVATFGSKVPRGDFGPRAEAICAYLGAGLRLSVRERQRLFEDLFGLRMSTGTVKAIDNRVSENVAAFYEEARTWLRQAAFAHADETSWPLGGHRGWLWVAVTDLVTIFQVDPKRNAAAFRSLFGPEFGGILITDRLASYDGHPEDDRQLCWAHLARQFQGFADHGAAEVQGFGNCGLSITERLFRSWGAYRDEHHDRSRLQREMKPLRRDLAALLITGALSGLKGITGFSNHLIERAGGLWKFADVNGVEPTNNNAERALRPAVLWRKGSFGSRSERGCRFVERLLTVIATLRSQGRDVLAFLADACVSPLHGLDPPSLLPTTSS